MMLYAIRYRAAVIETKPKEMDDGAVVYDLWEQRKSDDDDDEGTAPAATLTPPGGSPKPRGVSTKSVNLDEFYRDAVPFR